MEFILLLLETIFGFFELIPMEVLLSVFIAALLFLVRKVSSMETTFSEDVKTLRDDQAEMRREYAQLGNELKASIAKLAKDIEGDMQKQQDDLKKSYMLGLRTSIVNDSFPRIYRLERYDEYKELGGNSFVDDYVRNTLRRESDNE